MSNRRAFVLVITAVAAVVVWWLGRPQPRTPEPPAKPANPERTSAQTAPDPPATVPETPPVTVPEKLVPPPQATKTAPLPRTDRRDLQNPLAPASLPPGPTPRSADADPTAAADLDKISLMIRDYRTIAGENPVGTNVEIMKAMMGDNPRGAKIGPPEGMSVNREGELLDSWGTPIFFHQLSRDLMEIHSAGPDRRIGTDDDLMVK